MHVRVDDARHDIEPASIDRLLGLQVQVRSDLRDAALCSRKIGADEACRKDKRRPAHNEVAGIAHDAGR